jgi:response regulator RpfG family c-di-GMP phosphodiesterase
MSEGKILIVDDNESNLEIMAMYIESEFNNDTLLGSSSVDAIELMKENPEIDIVISDYYMPGGDGGELYKWLKGNKPDIPFILVCGENQDTVEKLPELQGLFSNGDFSPLVSKPFKKEELIEKMKMVMSKELTKVIAGYKRISIDRFLTFNKSFVGAHLKIGPSKMLKVVNKDDEISEELIYNIVVKGVKYLYIEEDEYEAFMGSAMDEVMQKLANREADEGEKLRLQMNSVESIHEGLRYVGMGQRAIELAQEVVDSTLNTIKSNKKISSILKSILKKDNYIYELSLLTCYISSAIANETEWATSETFKKLSYASLMQDVSLKSQDLAKVCKKSDVSFKKLNSAEQKEVLNHPIKSFEIVEKLGEVSPDVKNIIWEHHERPNGEGFPRGIDKNKIGALSCIFILAHEFSHRLLSEHITHGTLENIHNEFERNYSGGNFKKPHEALRKAFQR